MRDRLTRRILRAATALVAVVGFGACQDVAAPIGNVSGAPATPRMLITVNRMSADSSSADFTVSPTGGTFQIGQHAIYFPAYSICNPATSTYGVGTWDAPCEPLNSSIQIHAEVRRVNGRAWVDFTPSLRFVPTSSPYKAVWIWMRYGAGDALVAPTLDILWTPGPGQPGVDESQDDPSLRTYADPVNGVVYRRIKHFSGYMVAAG